MRKKFALLLAGAMTLSILLSACSVQMEDAVHTYTVEGVWTEAPSAAPVETASATPESDVPSAPAEASAPPTEPAGEPTPEAAGTDTPAAASAAPAVVSAPKPAVSTPAPAVNPPAPASDAPGAPDTPPPAAETLAPAPEPTPEPTPEPAPAATKADAQAFIGRSASSLIAAIGQPLSRSYAPSCLGDGEDGELIYSGFTVYTYREGDTETVLDVM